MDDTSPQVTRLLRERYERLSGEERLVIGAEMFETARTLVAASFPRGLSERERRRRLCERFYGELAERIFGKEESSPAG